MLREADRDRYLACLLSPQDKRGSLAALYAFNAEIARVRDVIREPLPGEIRLQWWRDLLEGQERGDSGGNPVAAALMAAIDRHNLPRQPLVDMVDARIFDLYDDPIADRNTFEGYAGETASALIQLASLILSPDHAAGGADAAGHAGVAQAVAGALLLLPIHRSRGQLYLPLDILSATGLDRNTFLTGTDRPRVAAAIEAFAGLGMEHLAKARKAGPVHADVFAAYLPLASTGSILDRASRLGAGALDGGLQPAQWRRQLRMMQAAFRKRF